MIRTLLTLLGCCLITVNGRSAGDDTAVISAKDIAARLATVQHGSAYVRLVMQIKSAPGAAGSTLQLQIKQRRTPEQTDVLYQVLWPKERKCESALLHQTSLGAATGFILLPPENLRQLTAGQMSEPLFGSDLSYQDMVEDFFAWPIQSLDGTESINRVNCVILESKPGSGAHSIYEHVRSWIDPRRFVPMRVEKYLLSGKLARRIDTTRVANDDNGRPIPANLAVRAGTNGSQTDLDGSEVRHNVTYSDHDFSTEGMKNLAAPHLSGP